MVDRGALNPSGLTEDLAELEREARALQRAMAETRETAESADGFVGATVNARGELVELVLDPRIYRTQDAAALAADITLAIRTAAGRAHERVVRTARRMLLPDATADTDLAFDAFLDQVGRAKGRTAP